MLMRSIHINGSNHCDTELSIVPAAPVREARSWCPCDSDRAFDSLD